MRIEGGSVVSPTIGRVLLLVDLDGVVYRGAEPVPGVAALLADRAANGDEIVYVTNNSMHYRADYVTRLRGMGAPVEQDRVISSPRATAIWLREHKPDIQRVLVVGGGGLERELRDQGYTVVTAAHAATRGYCVSRASRNCTSVVVTSAPPYRKSIGTPPSIIHPEI